MTLMEYVILIVVLAVLALGGGGWLLFVRPRRGRAVTRAVRAARGSLRHRVRVR